MKTDKIEVPCGKSTEVPVFYTNDLHGELENFGKIATILRKKKRDGEEFLLFDAGDFASGNAVADRHKGQPMVELFNITPYDAVGLGEGEFVFGLRRFQEILRELACPLVCANLYDREGRSFPGVQPFVIKEFHGMFFGVSGFLHPQTVEWARARANAALPDLEGITILPPRTVLSGLVQQMKAKGAGRFIFLAHLGMEEAELLAHDASPDVIVSGHSHDYLPQPARVKDTLIVTTGSGGRYLGSLTLHISDVVSMRITGNP